MRRIDRESLLKAFGDCSITPEYLQSHDAERKCHIKNTQWAVGVLDHIIEDLQRNDIPVPTAHKAAQRVKEVFLDLSNAGLTELDDCHEQFLQIVVLRQKLAELKCQILEIDTESELRRLQTEITETKRQQVIDQDIAYLDPDRE